MPKMMKRLPPRLLVDSLPRAACRIDNDQQAGGPVCAAPAARRTQHVRCLLRCLLRVQLQARA